jgi:hypothetical protein
LVYGAHRRLEVSNQALPEAALKTIRKTMRVYGKVVVSDPLTFWNPCVPTAKFMVLVV